MIGEAGHNIRSTLAAALKTTIWAGIMTGLAVVSIVLFTAALLIWLSDAYSALIACVIVGVIYLLLACVALLVFTRSRQRAARRARELTAAKSSTWLEPAIVATGLEIARALGGKRVSMIVAGAFAISWLLSHAPSAGQRQAARSKTRFES
jgi:hypothetical protein